jgi:hypothetical protein
MQILPPYIIEKIREYEESLRRRHEENRPRVWVPVPDLPPPPPPPPDQDSGNRGVIIIDINTYDDETEIKE